MEEKLSESVWTVTGRPQDSATTGDVLAIGAPILSEDGVEIPQEIRVGDRVGFSRYSGVKIVSWKGEKALLMREDDVLAVLDAQ